MIYYCKCGEEIQSRFIDYCSVECLIHYALDDNEDALIWHPTKGYFDEYGNHYIVDHD